MIKSILMDTHYDGDRKEVTTIQTEVLENEAQFAHALIQQWGPGGTCEIQNKILMGYMKQLTGYKGRKN